MVLILQVGCPLVVVDGVSYTLGKPVTEAMIELLRDILGWSEHTDAHGQSTELRSPPCRCGCRTVSEGAVTIAGS